MKNLKEVLDFLNKKPNTGKDVKMKILNELIYAESDFDAIKQSEEIVRNLDLFDFEEGYVKYKREIKVIDPEEKITLFYDFGADYYFLVKGEKNE